MNLANGRIVGHPTFDARQDENEKLAIHYGHRQGGGEFLEFIYHTILGSKITRERPHSRACTCQLGRLKMRILFLDAQHWWLATFVHY